MGFLSRRSRPHDEPPSEQAGPPASAEETVEQTPDEGGEIKISKGTSNGDSPTEGEPSAHHPAAADESEQARTTGRQGLPGGARQEPGDRAPSEASTGAKKDSKERLRLKPEEL